MTKPVYEQLLLRYEEYMAMPVAYDDLTSEETCQKYFGKSPAEADIAADDYEIVSLDQVDLDEFNNCVVIIKYGQTIPIENLTVLPQSPGTFIGWCNYKIVFGNKETLLLLSSYSSKRRFSIEAAPIQTDYLLINRSGIYPGSQIADFSSYIADYIKSSAKKILIIPTDFETSFIEIIFHVLSLVEFSGVQISVVSPIFKKLDLHLNIQSEWLNRDFFSISEPFPLKKYKNLGVFSSIFDSAFGYEGKNIVFCGCRYWDLLKDKKMFKESETVYINYEPGRPDTSFTSEDVVDKGTSKRFKVSGQDKKEPEYLPGIECGCSNDSGRLQSKERMFKLKVESTDEEIVSGYKGKVLTASEIYLHSERSTDSILVDSRLAVVGGKVLISGALLNSDADSPGTITMTLEDRPCFLKEVIRNEPPILIDGWFCCQDAKIKFRFQNGDQIEYYRF